MRPIHSISQATSLSSDREHSIITVFEAKHLHGWRGALSTGENGEKEECPSQTVLD